MTFFKKPGKLMDKIKKEKQPDLSVQNIENNSIEPTNHLSLDSVVEHITKLFSETQDLKIRWITLPADNKNIVLIYFIPLIDKNVIQDHIINPMMELDHPIDLSSLDKVANLEFKKHLDMNQVSELLIQSNTLVFTEDTTCFYSVFTPVEINRNIQEPDNETVLRGARDGFVENIMTNISLVRKRVKSPKLVVKFFKVGNESKTMIASLHVESIANPEVIKEVERRVQSIKSDNVVPPGNIEESIEDQPFSFFPQILSTERPDRVAAYLMEGKVVLLYDTSPTAHVVPVNFFTFYQSPDDYNKRWIIGSFFRMIRLVSFFIAIGMPAVYIAIISFHFEVIPADLILLIKSSLENIPYPPLFEALVMELTIELIREASIRLPSRIGSTIAIVGGLVIGDAVVKAGLVSNLMIIVVAVTAIAAYIVPSNEMSAAVRIMRFPFMLLAATLGFVGIIFGFMFLFFHLCRLYTFGTPFFFPLAPLRFNNFRDAFIRLPFWKQDVRPQDARPLDGNKKNHIRGWKQNE